MSPRGGTCSTVGTISNIWQILRKLGQQCRVMVEGAERARLLRLWQGKPFLQANVEILEEEFPGRSPPGWRP